jgi:hypothetical protein
MIFGLIDRGHGASHERFRRMRAAGFNSGPVWPAVSTNHVDPAE